MGKDESAKYMIDFPMDAEVSVAAKPSKKPMAETTRSSSATCNPSTCHNPSTCSNNACTGGDRIGSTIREFRQSLRTCRSGDSNSSPNRCAKRGSPTAKQQQQKEDDEKKKRMGSIKFYSNNHPSSGNISAKSKDSSSSKNVRRTLSLGNRILMQKNPKKNASTSLSPKKTKSNAVWGHVKKVDKKPQRSKSEGHKYNPMELYSNNNDNHQPSNTVDVDDLATSTTTSKQQCIDKYGDFHDDASEITAASKEESPRGVMEAPCHGASCSSSSVAKMPDKETWNCEFCTFANEPMHLVCEMCGQAKKGQESDNASANGGSHFEDDGSNGSQFSEEEKTEFHLYQEALSDLRPSSRQGDKRVFDYDGCRVYLQHGERKDVRWMDIFMQVNIAPQDMLKATKHLLKLNAEMAMASPIPIWFAMDEDENILFVNRMNWERLPTHLLDQHITRCIERMSVALLAEGIDVFKSGQ